MEKLFRILLVGSGGREFAFLKKFLKALEVRVTVAPGLSGMLYFLTEEERSRVTLVPQVKVADLPAMIALAREIQPDLIVVGPEDPLILGLADELMAAGFKVFGFSKAAAQLEGSKWFCKRVYQECGLATAPAVLVKSVGEAKRALAKFEQESIPIVLKCDGPALGKGVIIVPLDHSDYWAEQERQIALMFDPARPLGFHAQAVLLENRFPLLNEWSAMHVVGPNDFCLPLMPTKDHKLFNGLNTGGMGIITPAPGFDLEDMEKRRLAVNKVKSVLGKQGIELCGIYYEGLNRMMGRDHGVEVNVRGGDPEQQGQLEFLEGVPLHEILLAAVEGRPEILVRVTVPQNKVLVGVVMASKGYPGSYEKGKKIIIPEKLPAPGMIFPAGLVWEGGSLYTAGGRVLMAVGQGKSISEARANAYANVESIQHEEALVWRKDIGLAQ